jgi:amino acid adenylation domain-containing protein
VIYTSGSTGHPKGAMLSHRGIVNRLLWKQAAYALSPADVVLQKTPISFDVSVWELFAPLITGGRMILARPQGHRDNQYLAQLMVRESITVAHFVPSMLRPFLETPGLDDPGILDFSALRLVVASGEALSRDLAQRFAERLRCRLDNLYGPTEASVDVTSWRSDPETDPETPSVPIGGPIANTSIHLLDAAGEPAPPGFPGALMIGGINLARGYLRRPALTAERFVPDPFGAPGSRLYATGDLARRLETSATEVDATEASTTEAGPIEFLGRLDGQVKLRGQRIELGEIEAALARHPAVATAVASIFGQTPNEVLVAHWLRGGGKEGTSTKTLRTFLLESLPPAMVPTEFIALQDLPLTPSGKVDRRALPAPSREAKPERREPLNPVERDLLALCTELLDGLPVHIEYNFFQIGGNSITAITLVGRLQEHFQVEFSLAEIFAAETLQELATWILQRQAQQEDEEALAALLAELEDLPEEAAHDLLFEQEAFKAG